MVVRSKNMQQECFGCKRLAKPLGEPGWSNFEFSTLTNPTEPIKHATTVRALCPECSKKLDGFLDGLRL